MPTNGNGPTFGPFESESAIMDPQSSMEAAAASMQRILYENRGYYVSCEFLIGTNNLVTKEGILYDVGNNFIVIYEETQNQYIVCDFYSLKFVTFLPSRTPYLPQDGPPSQPQPRPRGTQGAPQNNNNFPGGSGAPGGRGFPMQR